MDQKQLSETQLLEALKKQYDLPFWPRLPFDHAGAGFTSKVPIQFLKRYVIVPFECSKPVTALDCGLAAPEADNAKEELFPPGFTIAMKDPSNFQALDDLTRILDVDDYRIVLSTRIFDKTGYGIYCIIPVSLVSK